jgi:hypothetical protein
MNRTIWSFEEHQARKRNEMLNPFASQSDPGSYIDLRKRMFQYVRQMKVNDKIFEAVRNDYEHALIRENVVLTRAEKDRMLSQIIKMVLEEMIKKLDEGPTSA